MSSVPAKVKKQKSPFEMRMAYFGLPAALVALTLNHPCRSDNASNYYQYGKHLCVCTDSVGE